MLNMLLNQGNRQGQQLEQEEEEAGEEPLVIPLININAEQSAH